MISIDVDQFKRSVATVNVNLAALMEKHVDAYKGACYLLGTEIVTRAMRKTPVDTGYLRASRYVTKPTFTATGGTFELTVGFSALYAIWVHDRDRNYTVGEWKFLRKAFDEVAANAESFIAKNTLRLAAAGVGLEGVPEVHPTGPLVGPHVHPRLRARRRRLEAQAVKDKRSGQANATRGRKSKP